MPLSSNSGVRKQKLSCSKDVLATVPPDAAAGDMVTLQLPVSSEALGELKQNEGTDRLGDSTVH